MSFDAVLEGVGSNGRYQILVFVIISVTMMLHGMMANVPVFITYKQKYRCKLTDNISSSFSGNASLVLDTCHVYLNSTPSVRVDCSAWDFDESVFKTTIRSRYNLTCGWDFLAELSTTIFFMGFMFGCVGYGVLSDRYGRLVGILTAGTQLSLFSLAASFAPNYTTFAFLRFIAGIGNGGMLACAFTMMAEVTDKKLRVLYSELTFNGYSYGTCVMALLGYYVRDELSIQLSVAIPILLIWVYPFLIPESPRWLFSTGRMVRAHKALKFVSRFNRRPMSEEIKDSIFREKKTLDEATLSQSAPKEREASLMDLMRTNCLRVTTLINWFAWFSVSTGFFAVVYTLGDIGGDLFLNLLYSALIEIPARLIAIFIANRWGRIPVISFSLVFGGLGCYLNAVFIYFPFLKTGLLVASVINKFWLTSAFDTLWAYSGELYPTVIRNVGVGAGSMCSRIGGMVAPQVSLLFDVWLPLPLILMGSLPLLAGLGFFLLPETLNRSTLEEIDDMVELVMSNSRFWRSKRKHKTVDTGETEKETGC